MTYLEIIAFIVGIVAVAFFLLSYLQKDRRRIIALNVTSRILYILQYILLGAFVGAVLDVAGAVSSLLAGLTEKPFIKKHKKLCTLDYRDFYNGFFRDYGTWNDNFIFGRQRGSFHY